jgi:predicted metal-dependent HD superfamily phosphohydrolase
VTEPSYDDCLVEAELRARAAYSEPHRRYHGQRHLDDCLALAEAIPDLNEDEARVLRWAILWHDAVYEPGHRDNEQKSAALAEFDLTRCGVPRQEAAEVARLIRLTEHHRRDPGDRLGRLLVSIDLAILGSDADRYCEYVSDVRAEYSHVPDPLWRTGRRLVLERLRGCDPLYPDADFEVRFGNAARQNIDAELKLLTEG